MFLLERLDHVVNFLCSDVGLIYSDFAYTADDQGVFQVVVTRFVFCLVECTTAFFKHSAKRLNSCGRVGGELLVYCLEPGFFLIVMFSISSPMSIILSSVSARKVCHFNSFSSSLFLRLLAQLA